ncbi:alpha-glucosidase [Enterobacter sp. CC120223-11]|uniref:glycoside hydrolase family 13 protein n=1 Tax=Enterobacter sp. CC120223-11 TaxID=1378073 RepID=UPI000BC7CC10|nr:alpha-glucosidase [Enterobacter sp. CC120223-11]SNY61120.1 oligo-1,6-glucosidase [Enterobacter sp. CC120223-11]
MKQKWWHSAVVYQIYPRSFMDSNGDGIGDLGGIISKLDYLHQLGITLIWLSPVYRSPMDDNGYDISDYEDIAAEFGTLAQMDELIEQAKRRDIHILMDLVVNHTSDEHPWFLEALKSPDNPWRDFYIWRKPAANGGPPNDFHSYFGGSGWALDEASGEYYLHQFSKRQPDLNWDNPRVHEEVHAMMNRWLARGIGGFRMDVIDLIGKEVDKQIMANGKNLHALIRQLNRATFGKGDYVTVGEAWSASPEDALLYSAEDRDELSMVFQFDHIKQFWDEHAGKWRSQPFELSGFKAVIDKWQTALAHVGWNSLFWSNHDLPRAVSKFGDEGEYREASAKMLATALHCLKGTPYIYQGEEIGMTNVRFDNIDDYRDIETLNLYRERVEAGISHEEMMLGIHANGRDNARTPMQWDTSANAGFTSGTPWIGVNSNYRDINVTAALAQPDSIFWHYRKLVALRKQHPILVYGDFQQLFAEHLHVFAWLRTLDDQTLLVINNFSRERVMLKLPQEMHGWHGECLIHHYAPRELLGSSIELQPYESFALLIGR